MARRSQFVHRRRCVLALGTLATCCTSVEATEIIWAGGIDLDWMTAANWKPPQVPGVEVAHASALVPGARGVVVAGLGFLDLNEVHFSTAVRFAGTSVVLQSGDATNLELTNDAVVFVLGDLATNGTTQWTYGRWEGSGTLENGGTIAIPSTSQPRTLELELKNTGIVNQAGRISVGDGAVITNEGSWVLTSAGSANILQVGGDPPGMFENHGFLKRTGAGTTEIWVPFVNEAGGGMLLDAGEVLLKAASEHKGGPIVMSNNAALRLWPDTGVISTVSGHATITGTGNVSHSGGTLHIERGATLTNELGLGSTFGLHFASSAQTIDIDGTIENKGKLTWDSGNVVGDGTLENGAGGVIILSSPGSLVGTLETHQGSQLFHNGNFTLDSGSVDAQAGSTWTIANGSIFTSAAGGSFALGGTLRKEGVANNPTLIGLPMIVESGTIDVAGPGELNFINGATFVGTGKLKIGAGTSSKFDSGSFLFTGNLDLEGNGSFSADSPSQLHFAGGTLKNTMSVAVGACTFTGVQCSGTSVDSGGILNERHMVMSSCTLGTTAAPGVRVVNNQVITFNGGGSTLRGTIVNHHIVDQSTGLDLQGGKVVNQKEWNLFAGSDLLGPPAISTFTNAAGGTLRKDFGPQSYVFPTLDNQGTVEAVDGTLTIGTCSQIQGDTLSGGTWIAHESAVIEFAGVVVRTIAGGTKVKLHGPNIGLLGEDFERIETNGTVELDTPTEDQSLIQMPHFNELRGRLVLRGVAKLDSKQPIESILGDTAEVPEGQDSAGETSGPRLITPRYINGGRILPGDTGLAGPFRLEGVLDQEPAGLIQIELRGPTPIVEHDQVIVDGDVELDGTLEVSLLGGFEPRVGDEFTVLVATGAITGDFDSIDSVGAGTFDAAVRGGAVVLTLIAVAVPGDLTGDGIVDGNDLGTLLGEWGDCPGCIGDLNGDGVVDGSDLGDLLGFWT